MTPALRVTGVNGSYGEPSKTAALIELIVAELAERRLVESRRLDVAALGPGFTGALQREDLSPEALEAVEHVESADVLIAATPIYRGSYSGLFKHFFDLVEQYALAGKPVILAATGGSDRHTLAVDHALRPLFAFFQAHVSPVGVFASSGDFAGQSLLNPEVYARIELAVQDLLPVMAARRTA